MNRLLFFSFFLLLFFSCSDLESVEVKEGDVVTESYTRRKSDFAKQGTYTRFSPDGKIMEKSEYQDDKLNGKQEFFYANGQVQELFHYKNGIHQGEYKTYFEDGKIQQEGNYVNGKWEGELKVYYPNGQLKEVVIYENNKEMGPFTEYHANGKIKTEGTYQGADPDTNIALEHGELKKYDENGEHYQTMNCNYGRCLTTWKKEGVKITED